MITREDAEEMSLEEAAQTSGEEAEDRETLQIIVEKTLFYLAVKGKLEMGVNEGGNFVFWKKP